MSEHGSAREKRRQYGQHFLQDHAIANELVTAARVGSADLVVDVGAGSGILTEHLARRGAEVWAVERDAALVRQLRDRFAGQRRIKIIHQDILKVAMPNRSYKVVANIPFNRTTAILHHILDDVTGTFVEARLIVEWDVAKKRARELPMTLLGAQWGPWYEFAKGRRIAASCFRPRPKVDAGILMVRRRIHPLVPPPECFFYSLVMDAAFKSEANLFRGRLPKKPQTVNLYEWISVYESMRSQSGFVRRRN